jgi:hypothetical protein
MLFLEIISLYSVRAHISLVAEVYHHPDKHILTVIGHIQYHITAVRSLGRFRVAPVPTKIKRENVCPMPAG